MNAITLLSAQPWVERLGWTILHFLWQGSLIAAVYGAIRALLRGHGSNARYLAACFALIAMVVTPVVTWKVLQPQATVSGTVLSSTLKPSTPPPARQVSPLPVPVATGAAIPEPVLSWVVAIWVLGSCAFWIRLAGGWVLAMRLRSVYVRPAPTEWQQILDRLKARIRISSPVRLLVSPIVSAPMVIGWLRPVILIPVAAVAGLPPEQLEGLLIHELAHIRRADYAVNLLQSVIEAVLFYHPAVWWISGHLREEREVCCDDIAVSVTGDAVTYARALAELASSRLGWSEAALAATGGNLTYRIARLLGQPRCQSRRFNGPEVLAGAILLIVAAVSMFGQSAARPKFEVASIKPSQEQRFMTVRPLPGGRLTATAPLRLLIQNAYRLQSFQIVGGPGWINTDRYQIEAKADTKAGRDQVFEMLQSLLEDRFQLKVHRETREMPVYDLVATRNGPKLPAPKEGACVEADPDAPPTPGRGFPCGRAGIMYQPSGAKISGSALAMPELVRILGIVMGRTVIDRTGVTAKFDAQLNFTPDATTEGLMMLASPTGPAGAAPSAESINPSIFTALQEQLGLKLESAKGPVDVLVIDHVERPSGN